jgi:hyperosmotically inducible periplasmic protein
MKPIRFSAACSICATSILGLSLICGCSSTSKTSQHPDEIDSVTNALAFNGLSTVNVSQDRAKGVMTLTGTVASPDQRAQAATITSTNANDYTIANDIVVTPPAVQAKADSSSEITNEYQAELKAHKDLDVQHIDYKVDRGTIVLSGRVHSRSQRSEAVKLAESVPNVQHVVDEIKVHS